jgi:CBS domain-containing protein
MLRRDIAFTPMHATLFLLGIYDDTGNLTYPNTKADDLKAAAYLIENGADLNIVNAFLNDSFDSIQQDLLKAMLDGAETINHNGVYVGLSHIRLDTPVNMLSQVVGKFREISGSDVAFGIFSFYDKSFVIARSILPDYDVGCVVRKFGGGGHPGAASAVVSDKGPEEIYDKARELILNHDGGFVTVEEIMYMPSEAVDLNRKISDIKAYMDGRHLKHLLALDDGAVFKGAVSDTDIENALLKGQGNSPLKVLFQKKPITAGRRQSIREAATLMMDNDISVLPVMEGKTLLGIVGRNDLMLYLYDI